MRKKNFRLHSLYKRKKKLKYLKKNSKLKLKINILYGLISFLLFAVTLSFLVLYKNSIEIQAFGEKFARVFVELQESKKTNIEIQKSIITYEIADIAYQEKIIQLKEQLSGKEVRNHFFTSLIDIGGKVLKACLVAGFSKYIMSYIIPNLLGSFSFDSLFKIPESLNLLITSFNNSLIALNPLTINGQTLGCELPDSTNIQAVITSTGLLESLAICLPNTTNYIPLQQHLLNLNTTIDGLTHPIIIPPSDTITHQLTIVRDNLPPLF